MSDRHIEDIRLDVLRLGCAQHAADPEQALRWAEAAMLLVEGGPQAPPATEEEAPPLANADHAPPPAETPEAPAEAPLAQAPHQARAGNPSPRWTPERRAELARLIQDPPKRGGTGKQKDWHAIVAALNALPGPAVTVDQTKWMVRDIGDRPAAPPPAPPREMGAWPSHPTPIPVIAKWAMANVDAYLTRHPVADQLDRINEVRVARNLPTFTIKQQAAA